MTVALAGSLKPGEYRHGLGRGAIACRGQFAFHVRRGGPVPGGLQEQLRRRGKIVLLCKLKFPPRDKSFFQARFVANSIFEQVDHGKFARIS
jgi:hypothetical protein